MPHALAETITNLRPTRRQRRPSGPTPSAQKHGPASRSSGRRGPGRRARTGHRAPPRARRRARRDRRRLRSRRRWKVRYALMLGLERVLSEKPPRLASGTELRRHQVDALAGMLTELIAAAQKTAENGNGNGNGDEPPPEEDDEHEDELELAPELEDDGDRAGAAAGRSRTRARSAATASATRPRRARRSPPPGFVEAARTEGVLILTHRRLLVDQFRRELTDHGYGEPLPRRDPRRAHRAARLEPDHDPDLRLVRAPRRRDLARRVPARDLRRGAHRARREDLGRDPHARASRSTSA